MPTNNAHPLSQNLSVWQKRWASLNEAIQTLHTEQVYPRRETLEQIRDCLQLFAERQFKFFVDGFGEQKEFVLEPCEDYATDSVFQAILQQVAYDINVIRWAGIQRVFGYETMKETLIISDQLAQICLDAAINHNFIEETVALTYFQKAANIRVIPYAPVALVTVPETATHVKRDFLATPHEVGHYVFRHGKLANGITIMSELRRSVAQEPRWLKKWLEEIFADVYGCLIGGTAMGLDFQDILLDNSLPRFLADDGEHPIPAIRPYIYTQVLEHLGFIHAPQKLEDRWIYWLQNRGNPTQFTLHTPEPDGTTIISMAEAKQHVTSIVTKILALLQPLVTERQQNPAICWTVDVQSDDDLLQPEESNDPNGPLYGQFYQYLENNISVDLPANFPELRLSPDNSDQVTVTRGQTPSLPRQKGTTGLWFDSLTAIDGMPTQFPPEVWQQFLSANGWTVKGPENSWPP